MNHAFHESLNLLLVVSMLLNFFVLVASNLRTAIYLVGIQGMVIGIMPLLVHQGLDVRVVLLSVGTIVIKGIFFPRMLIFALREIGFQREQSPLLGYIPASRSAQPAPAWRWPSRRHCHCGPNTCGRNKWAT